MSPLALSPPQKTNKKKKIRTEDIHRPPAGILSARSQPRRAANYRWAHHWRGTNPQHNALPNTAEIRLIPDYMYNRTHCWRTVRNPMFWHRLPSPQLWARCPHVLAPRQKRPYLGPESLAECEKHLSCQLLMLQLQPSWHLTQSVLELCCSRVCPSTLVSFKSMLAGRRGTLLAAQQVELRNTESPEGDTESLSLMSQGIPFVTRPEARWEECLSLCRLKSCYSETN